MTLQFEGVGFGAGPGSGGKIGTVALVAMGSQPSTPYTVGSKWFYNGLIYTATSTTTTDGGVTPSYDTAYLYNGTYYYWDGSALQGADESNLVHISGTETITGDKTFSGELKAVTQPVTDASEKAATTQFVKDFDDAKEWTPPSDWIDIRSGALPNSFYLLAGHPSDYSSLDQIGFSVTLSDETKSFEVYIDDVLYGTFLSGTFVSWLWSQLALTTGRDTTFPINLKYHVIRITPVDSDVTLQTFLVDRQAATGDAREGILWFHFSDSYPLRKIRFALYSRCYQYYLTAITSLNNKLYFEGNDLTNFLGENYEFPTRHSVCLATIPDIEIDSLATAGGAFNQAGPLKKIKLTIKNDSAIIFSSNGDVSNFCYGTLEELEVNVPIVLSERTNATNSMFRGSSLRKLPTIDYTKSYNNTNFLTNNTKLKDTIMDMRKANSMVRLQTSGTSSLFMSGLKGLLVSSQAPFDYTTEPQISVAYTAMSRAALVRLFKSLPYNVGYKVVGSPTIVDGVASNMNSGTDYIETTKPFDAPNVQGFELVFNIPTRSSGAFIFRRTTQQLYAFTVRYEANGELSLILPTRKKALSQTGVRDSYSWIKILTDSPFSTVQMWGSNDGNSWTELTVTIENLEDTVHTASSVYRICNFSDTSIKLPNSYIKVNGIPWLRGTTMTKTISVVGCTGTPDLTAEDKAIAEDKGWSIVLA